MLRILTNSTMIDVQPSVYHGGTYLAYYSMYERNRWQYQPQEVAKNYLFLVYEKNDGNIRSNLNHTS